jgi:hypothetical protein
VLLKSKRQTISSLQEIHGFKIIYQQEINKNVLEIDDVVYSVREFCWVDIDGDGNTKYIMKFFVCLFDWGDGH